MRLQGKAAVVTGAASGIGAAVAQAFLAEGATVGLLDQVPSTSDGPRTVELLADVTAEDSMLTAFANFEEQAGKLDVLVCCAAVQLFDTDGPVGDLSLTTWRRTIDVNLTGVFLSMKYAVPAMQRAGGGSIIVAGSPTGLTMCGAGTDAYSASKGGAMALVRAVAGDYAGSGIRANIVVPGTIETPLIASLVDDEKRRSELIGGTPIGRLGVPADVTGAFVFLASDESAFATAATFVIDGGLTVR